MCVHALAYVYLPLQDEVAPDVQHVVQRVEEQTLGCHRSVGVGLLIQEHQKVQFLS